MSQLSCQWKFPPARPLSNDTYQTTDSDPHGEKTGQLKEINSIVSSLKYSTDDPRSDTSLLLQLLQKNYVRTHIEGQFPRICADLDRDGHGVLIFLESSGADLYPSVSVLKAN